MNSWKTSNGKTVKKQSGIQNKISKKEMADVLIYLVQLADKMDIDLEEEVLKKMKKNELKYPVQKG
jgi:NTP pyrophosphatase (non-canonical NTP hydrolase)